MVYLDEDLISHPKVWKAGLSLGPLGPVFVLAMHVAGLSYARKFLTDGFIPEAFLGQFGFIPASLSGQILHLPEGWFERHPGGLSGSLAETVSPLPVTAAEQVRDKFETSLRQVRAEFVTIPTAEMIVTAMCARGVKLWHRHRGGYLINDFTDWNKSGAEIKKKRADDRERQRRHRANKPRPGEAPPESVTPFVTRDYPGHVHNHVHDHVVRTASPPARSDLGGTSTEEQEPAPRDLAPCGKLPDPADAPSVWPAVDRVIRLNRRERSRETDSGRPSVPVLAAIARTVLLEHPDEQDEGELKELLKCAAVRANLLYDSTSVSDALDRARHQLSRRKDALAC